MAIKRLSRERRENRVRVLTESLARISEKILATPEHPDVEAWKARAAEYRQSLANIQEYGAEVVADADRA